MGDTNAVPRRWVTNAAVCVSGSVLRAGRDCRDGRAADVALVQPPWAAYALAMRVSTVFFIAALGWLGVFLLGVILEDRPAGLWMVLGSVAFFACGVASRDRPTS